MSIKSLFEDIADAIREKSGSSDTYTPAEMPSAIRSIPSGSSTASGVSYDNTSSGLTASNVQDAIDELSGDVLTINSDLSELKTWKLHDTKSLSEQTGGYLPTSFNELLIIIHRNHSGSSYQRLSPILIPYAELEDTGVAFTANTQVWGTGYCAFVTVSKTAWNALKLRQIRPNDTTVTETTDGVINIYYK